MFDTVVTGEEMMDNCYAALEEIDYDERKTMSELAGAYVKYHNVGADVGGGFENRNEIKRMKYQAAIGGPDGNE